LFSQSDGDARGGAALSIRETTGVPIKFLALEKRSPILKSFIPHRLAAEFWIKGMCSTWSKKPRSHRRKRQHVPPPKKFPSRQLTFEDFLQQIQMMKKMGGMNPYLDDSRMGQISKQLKDMAAAG